MEGTRFTPPKMYVITSHSSPNHPQFLTQDHLRVWLLLLGSRISSHLCNPSPFFFRANVAHSWNVKHIFSQWPIFSLEKTAISLGKQLYQGERENVIFTLLKKRYSIFVWQILSCISHKRKWRNWKSLPGARYEQKVQRFQCDLTYNKI